MQTNSRDSFSRPYVCPVYYGITNKSTEDKFSALLGYSIHEAALCKHAYLLKLKAGDDPDSITDLPHTTLTHW